MRIEVTIVNTYDETVQTKATLTGSFEISLIRDAAVRKTINVGTGNLVSTRFYDPTTKVLTIDPGDSIRFVYDWNFIDNNNVFLPQDVFHYSLDQTCPGRYLSFSESFAISGSIQIAEKLENVQCNPVVYNLCYVDKYMSPHDCPPPPTECAQR
jgi:hypothetical protein